MRLGRAPHPRSLGLLVVALLKAPHLRPVPSPSPPGQEGSLRRRPLWNLLLAGGRPLRGSATELPTLSTATRPSKATTESGPLLATGSVSRAPPSTFRAGLTAWVVNGPSRATPLRHRSGSLTMKLMIGILLLTSGTGPSTAGFAWLKALLRPGAFECTRRNGSNARTAIRPMASF